MQTRLFTHELTVSSEQAGMRLDFLLSRIPFERFDEHFCPSRATLQKWIAAGYVSVNGSPMLDKSYQVKAGDRIEVNVTLPTEELIPPPEPLDIQIVFMDPHLVVIDKPPGITSHPMPSEVTGSVVNFLRYKGVPLPALSNPLRPGIVHRLDKNTSGLMVVACTDAAFLALTAMIKRRELEREYLALVCGTPPVSGTIDAPLERGGIDNKRMVVGCGPSSRPAVTHYAVLESWPGYSLVRCRLETGRTHQIRVHMSHIGFPVAGDPTYGGRKSIKWLESALKPFQNRQDFQHIDNTMHKVIEIISADKVHLLHAAKLSFVHPITRELLSFEAEPHEKFRKVLDLLRTLPHRD